MWLGYSDEAEDDVRNTRDIMLALTAAISAAASYSGLLQRSDSGTDG